MDKDEKTKIGKDVIESLTLAMYDDPRFIYREYVQNSADQIDIALEKGIIRSKNECKIEITIDKDERKITIFDNATGLESTRVLSVLKNIAQGVKDRNKNKGFRGIGRLGGLAYCDKLIFETSYLGEEIKSILTWDAKELKKIINDRNTIEDASYVIDLITSLSTESENKEERYFKVILENVTNDTLLNKKRVHDYLSMVAPVCYKKGFYFDKKIYEKAKEFNYVIDEYNIYINNDQLFKEYTTSIYEKENDNRKKIDEICDIDFFDIKDNHGQLLGWGWNSISHFTKQIPPLNLARGIRLRKNNIQIGNEGELTKLFIEQRGSFYFFGEIHCVSQNLIPNARRDYFVENETLKVFEGALRKKFAELRELYYLASNIRGEKRKIERVATLKEEYDKKSIKGFTKPEEQKEYIEKINKAKKEAQKAQENLNKIKSKIEQDNKKRKLFENIIPEKEIGEETPFIIENSEDNLKPKLLTDNLSQYDRAERKLISKILSIIDKLLTPDISETVKEKIIEELKK